MKATTTRRRATLRDMLFCCLSPPSRLSSDNVSGDESFTPIEGIRRSAKASRSAPLTGPGAGLLQVATQELMMTMQHSGVLDHQGSLPLEPQPPPPRLELPTCAAASAASSYTSSRPAAGSDTSIPADVVAGAPPVDIEASTSDSNIHRHSTLLVGSRSLAGTHKISLGILQQLVPRGRPGRGSSCGGGHDAISVRAAISASLAHHIGAAPAAASSFAFAARSGPVRKGPAASAAPSMALAHLSMARWANLLLPSSPASFPAMASASAFPALSPTIMISSRPSTEVDPGRNGAQQRRLSDSAAGLADASLPVGAAAYIMRNKGQGVEVGNPLATQDFDILGSATSSRSGGGSVNGAAGWYI